jgi:hypothetical protein
VAKVRQDAELLRARKPKEQEGKSLKRERRQKERKGRGEQRGDHIRIEK